MTKDRSIPEQTSDELEKALEDLGEQLQENLSAIAAVEERISEEAGATDRLCDEMYVRDRLLIMHRCILTSISSVLLVKVSNEYLSHAVLTKDEYRDAHQNYLIRAGFRDAVLIVHALPENLRGIRWLPAVHRVVIEARSVVDDLFEE